MSELMHQLTQYRASSRAAEQMRLAEGIVQAIQGRLRGYLRLKLPETAVEDVLQDVLLAIVRGWDGCKATTESQFMGWCLRIVSNHCVNFYRKRRPEFGVDDAELWNLIEAGGAIDPASPEEREELELALSWLRKAEPGCREVLVLNFFMDLDLADVAAVLGLTYDATRIRRRRCLERARESIERQMTVRD